MTSRAAAVLVFAGFLSVAAVAVALGADPPRPPDRVVAPLRVTVGERVVGYGQIRYAGLGPERWAQRYRRERDGRLALEAQLVALRARLHADRRVVLRDANVVEAINLACAVYGNCATLWRKARCETGGSFNPYSKNPSSSASGLFQFLDSTWASTPFGRFSVWSPYANALAAGWMHTHGRGGEWVCQ